MATSDQSRLSLVQRVVVALEESRRQEPLIDVRELAREAHERTPADEPGDLALEACVPAARIELALEQEGGAGAVGASFEPHGVALQLRAAPAGLLDVARSEERRGGKRVDRGC